DADGGNDHRLDERSVAARELRRHVHRAGAPTAGGQGWWCRTNAGTSATGAHRHGRPHGGIAAQRRGSTRARWGAQTTLGATREIAGRDSAEREEPERKSPARKTLETSGTGPVRTQQGRVGRARAAIGRSGAIEDE